MLKYIRNVRTLGAAPLLAAILAVAACSSDKKPDALAQDSTLSRDIQLANRDSTVQPQLQDVPATTTPAPAPVTTRPRVDYRAEPRHYPQRIARAPQPAPAPPPMVTTTPSGNTMTRTPGRTESAIGTISAGSTLNLSSDARICTNTNHVGDRVTGTLANAVSGSNGAVIPAGATATLEVTSLHRSGSSSQPIDIGFRMLSISFGGHTYPVTGTIASAQVDRVRTTSTTTDAEKVGGGAVAGAILGQIIGHSTKATVIGGAVGAAAGAGAAAATGTYDGCVPNGGRIAVTLNGPVEVHT